MDSHQNNNNNNNILMDFLCKTFFSLFFLCTWNCFDFLRRRRRKKKKSISVWLVTFTSRATGFLIKLAHTSPFFFFFFFLWIEVEKRSKVIIIKSAYRNNSLLGFSSQLLKRESHFASVEERRWPAARTQLTSHRLNNNNTNKRQFKSLDKIKEERKLCCPLQVK